MSDAMREALQRIARYPWDDPKSNDAQIIHDLARAALAPQPALEPTAELSHMTNCGAPEGDRCTCGLKYRIELQTEREMHHAWRKRAEEAEAAPAALEPTEAMLNAARDWSYKKYGKPIGNDAAIGCWKAMFEAFRSQS